MLFRQDILTGIADGRVTLAFRRWRRSPPANGSSLRTPVGVLCLTQVTIVDEDDITPEDVRRTGMSIADLRASIAGEGRLLRIELRQRLPEHRELEAIAARLARFDATSTRAWSTRYLTLIAEQPGVVSHALSRRVDDEVLPFKRRVRQLKELGLTESLDVGYRLSPRGRVVLEHLTGRS